MDNNIRKRNMETIKFLRLNSEFDLDKFLNQAEKMDKKTLQGLVRTLRQANDDFYEDLYDEGMESDNENWSQKIERDIESIFIELAKIKNAPVHEIAEAIIDGENPYWIYQFAYQIKNAPTNLLAYALIDILRRGEIDEEESAKFMYMFAKYIEKAPIEDMARVLLCDIEVVECSASKYLLKFAKLVDGELKTQLLNRYKEHEMIMKQEREEHSDIMSDEDYQEME